MTPPGDADEDVASIQAAGATPAPPGYLSGGAALLNVTPTPADVEFVDPGRGRGPSERLGMAVQLCTLPWLGHVPDDVASAPPAAVARLSARLQVPAGELRRYGERKQTRTDHLRSTDPPHGPIVAVRWLAEAGDPEVAARALRSTLDRAVEGADSIDQR